MKWLLNLVVPNRALRLAPNVPMLAAYRKLLIDKWINEYRRLIEELIYQQPIHFTGLQKIVGQ